MIFYMESAPKFGCVKSGGKFVSFILLLRALNTFRTSEFTIMKELIIVCLSSPLIWVLFGY